MAYAIRQRSESTGSLDRDDDEHPFPSALEIVRASYGVGKREIYPDWLFEHPKGLYVLAATEVRAGGGEVKST